MNFACVGRTVPCDEWCVAFRSIISLAARKFASLARISPLKKRVGKVAFPRNLVKRQCSFSWRANEPQAFEDSPVVCTSHKTIKTRPLWNVWLAFLPSKLTKIQIACGNVGYGPDSSLERSHTRIADRSCSACDGKQFRLNRKRLPLDEDNRAVSNDCHFV